MQAGRSPTGAVSRNREAYCARIRDQFSVFSTRTQRSGGATEHVEDEISITVPRRAAVRLGLAHGGPGADEPRGHVVERSAAASESGDGRACARCSSDWNSAPPNGGLPEDERALIERQHVDPVDLQRVRVADVRVISSIGIRA